MRKAVKTKPFRVISGWPDDADADEDDEEDEEEDDDDEEGPPR